MTNAGYSVEVVTDEDKVVLLREDWDRLSLSSSAPNVFMTFDWFMAWYQFLGREHGSVKPKPHILLLKSNGIIAGISPLVLSVVSRFGCLLRRLQFVMRSLEWDYNDLCLGNDVEGQSQAIADFLSRNRNDWDIVEFRSLREDGNAIASIRSALAHADLRYQLFPEEERCPYMTIDAPWSRMAERHSRSTRRMANRLKEMLQNGLSSRVVENPQEDVKLLNRMIAIEAQKCVNDTPSPPFLGKYPDVFSAIFGTLGPKGWISVVLLERGEELIAWQLLYRSGKKLWGYLTAYHHDFSRLSPGVMLISVATDYGFEKGFDEFDFLSGEESYKMRWATGFHNTHHLLIWNTRWLSRLKGLVYLRLRARTSASS
jgi:CelD/BcsL family acetyltransferase involved in cellulose biosynthesis